MKSYPLFYSARCGFIGLLVLIGSMGCMSLPTPRPEPSYEAALPYLAESDPGTDGAVYRTGMGLNLFTDRKGHRVGDLVTIRFEERTSSSKKADTTIKKDSTTTNQEPLVMQSLIRGVASNAGVSTSLDGKRDFSGESESDQSNQLSGTLTAVVSAVYPNGLMLVQGEKWLNLNRGEEYIRVRGLLRPEDIDGTNTVSSLRLADARIAYSGTGELANSNSAGWLSRFFLSPLFPF